jgi:hypothetical protein
MKTTPEIAGSLLRKARKGAACERRQQRPFRLRKASFNGRGLSRELAGAKWDRIRALAYAELDF